MRRPDGRQRGRGGADVRATLPVALRRPPAPPPSPAGIAADIRVRLGEFTLELELDVPAGGITAVMGPNGSGKTTLLRCLAGLVPTEAGRLSLAGNVVDDPAEGIWVPPEKRPVGYAFQDVRLFGHLNTLDNVAFGPRCRGTGRVAARHAALASLAEVSMGEATRIKPARLSGGQAQRVGLARALAGRPEVLLLDEPFSATDADVRPLLRRQVRAAGATVVLVTHDPADAAELADEVLLLEAGRAAG